MVGVKPRPLHTRPALMRKPRLPLLRDTPLLQKPHLLCACPAPKRRRPRPRVEVLERSMPRPQEIGPAPHRGSPAPARDSILMQKPPAVGYKPRPSLQ